ncbi:MAG: OmpA family protein, partial [Pseudomonadota bacterium]
NLSQRRANAVRTYLVNKGVAADRLIAKGYGETKPLVADRAVIGVDSQDRAKNRRTEFTIVSN